MRHAVFVDGRATSIELTTPRPSGRARLAAIDARIEARIAAVRLTHALGHDTAMPCATSCQP